MNDPNKLDLEKLKIHQRLLIIENYIKEGKEQRDRINDTMSTLNIRAKNLELMIQGDSASYDKVIRDGINRRVESVEKAQRESEKDAQTVKGNFLKVAVGAITLAVGAFMMWLFKLIMAAVGKQV